MKQRFRVINGDSLELLNTLEANSIDSCVCDPPYELGFMGKKWDSTGIANNVELWKCVLRVLKPGAHLIAFGGTRTYHRMVCAIEDAGFEIRDQIGWVYGSGFPKSLDVSKAIDKANGAKREVLREYSDNGRKCSKHQNTHAEWKGDAIVKITAPTTIAAKKWNGWGTALKPAWEPIVLARKPLIGTVVENVQLHGTGAINVDACRVEIARRFFLYADDRSNMDSCGSKSVGTTTNGRWPANVIHDGSEEVLAEFAKQSSLMGMHGAGRAKNADRPQSNGMFKMGDEICSGGRIGDKGTAARFFYCAKASKRDRDEGLNGFEERESNHAFGEGFNTATKVRTEAQSENGVQRELRRNNHPTVKPTALMRYLCKLITPPGGLILDPFTGSGSTGKAAMLEGFRFVGIELSAEYAAIARARISSVVLTKADKKNTAKPL